MSDGQPRDRQWFRTLYPRCHDKVARRITRQVAVKEVAEELTDETFKRVWEHRHKVPDEEGEAVAYVLGMARKVVQDHFRKSMKMRTEVLDEAVFEVADAERDFAQRVADGLDLRRAFRRLSLSDRELLWRAEVDGASIEEIAREEGVSVNAIYKRLERARTRLRGRMKRNNVLEGRLIQVRRS